MTTTMPPICTMCQHLARDESTGKPERPLYHCAAFPQGIPGAIVFSQADHRQPFDGDHGIRFKSDSPHGDAYAALVMGDAHKGDAKPAADKAEDKIVGKPVIKGPMPEPMPKPKPMPKRGDHVFRGPKPWK